MNEVDDLIIWLIGMSGSGKTTLGRKLYEARKSENKCTVFLDGDHVRDMLKNDVDHSIEGRYKNAERISHMCKYFDDEGIDVVAAVLSIFPEWQAWNRENFSEYFEIFLDVPMNILVQRDPKGLYKQAAAGELQNFVGFDIKFPKPENSDLIVSASDMRNGVEQTLRKIMERL